MKKDVANRWIWFMGDILNVNDAKINILSVTNITIWFECI